MARVCLRAGIREEGVVTGREILGPACVGAAVTKPRDRWVGIAAAMTADVFFGGATVKGLRTAAAAVERVPERVTLVGRSLAGALRGIVGFVGDEATAVVVLIVVFPFGVADRSCFAMGVRPRFSVFVLLYLTPRTLWSLSFSLSSSVSSIISRATRFAVGVFRG